jgi:hypothetical protein
MGKRIWNVYKRGGANARVGDRVFYQGRTYTVLGTKGSDSDGVPYVRLEPTEATDDDGRREVVCLVTAVERAA